MASKVLRSIKINVNKFSPYQWFMLVRLMLGFYFKISSSKLINGVVRLYCIAFPIGLSAIVLIYRPTQNNALGFLLWVSYSPILIMYMFFVLVSHYNKQEHISRFLTFISIIDKMYGKEKKMGIAVSYGAIAVIVLQAFGASALTINSWKANNTLGVILMIFANDTCFMTVTIVLGMMRARMQILHHKTAQLYSLDSTIDDKMRAITKILNTYKHLMDNFNEIEKVMKYHVLLSVCIYFIRTTGCLTAALSFALQIVPLPMPELIAVFVHQGTMIVVTVATPCMVAESVLYEVDQLKAALGDHLLEAHGEFRELLLEFVEYVEGRPPVLHICIAQFGARTLTGLLNLCTTYVIILLQYLNR